MDGIAETLHWLPGSPFRKPCWRWLRAGYLGSTRRRLDSRIDDDWVAQARLPHRAIRRCREAEERKHVAINAAFALWNNAGPPLRDMLEAYLLTPLPFDRIASILGLHVDVVTAYHALFFDVRSLPHATDWLLREAVEWNPWIDAGAPELGRVWKYLALVGGENVLEVAIAVTTNTPLPAWLTTTFSDPAADELRLRLTIKASICALTARSPAQWKALAVLRRRLKALGGNDCEEQPEDGLLGAMEEFLALPSTNPREAAAREDAGTADTDATNDVLIPNTSEPCVRLSEEHKHSVAAGDETICSGFGSTSATNVSEVPSLILEFDPLSWRTFDAENADHSNDGTDLDRTRCRVFVSES